MQELLNALEAFQKSIDGFAADQRSNLEQFAAITEQFKAQKVFNEKVIACLRYLMGVEPEKPTLRLVTDDPE